MVLAVGKKLFLGGVREREMAEVVKQRCEANNLPPCHECIVVREDVEVPMPVPFMRQDIEDSSSQFHHAERVFKSTMRCSRVDEVGQRQLMYVSEPLKRPGVDRGNFIG